MRQQKTFLLRLWNDSGKQENWRASLENTSNKERQNFASLEQVLAHISEIMEDDCDED